MSPANGVHSCVTEKHAESDFRAGAQRHCCSMCVVKYIPPATQNTGAWAHWHGRRAAELVVRVRAWVGPAGRRGERVIAV